MMARLALFVVGCSLAVSALAADPFRTATQDQVAQWIASRDAVVYDVNPDEVYAKNHLPGARFIASDAWTATLPADKAARLVFYCANPR